VVLNPARNCRIYLFERDYCRGPGVWLCAIVWNRVDDIQQREIEPGERYFMDEMAIRWRWPRKLKS